jgi:hypothetical protein
MCCTSEVAEGDFKIRQDKALEESLREFLGRILVLVVDNLQSRRLAEVLPINISPVKPEASLMYLACNACKLQSLIKSKKWQKKVQTKELL